VANRRLGIRARFLLSISVLVPAILALTYTAKSGLDEQDARIDTLYQQGMVVSDRARDFDVALERVDRAVLQMAATNDGAGKRDLAIAIDAQLAPAVDSTLAALAATVATDHTGKVIAVLPLRERWAQFRRLWHTLNLDTASGRALDAKLATLQAVFQPLTAAATGIAEAEAQDASRLAAEASRSHPRTVRRVYEITAVIGVLALAVALWLAASIVPRARRYSKFATEVAAGRGTAGVDVSGGDELTDLGRSLNEMIRARTVQEQYDRTQAEFAETLQLTENEGEAHGLIKIHLERSVPGSSVVVLNRNNSEDRLEPKTEVADGSPLVAGLDGAKPRDCLAVRFARPYSRGTSSDEPLLSCAVCGKLPDETRCQPLLVGGEVIGSVLTNYSGSDGPVERRITDSITQAAPVLANLRNLAIAEVRAATDALTGLPNARAVQDTAKRMVAESLRTGNPLSALALDLDHFKQINDTYGHGAGDEVLAAVGEALRSTIRESDFGGRYGGEEFMVLLPNTDLAAATLVAEKIRKAIAGIQITAVDRRVTISVGVASLPLHAHDTPGLIRAADRALYSAKANGRNRTEAVQASATPDAGAATAAA
jgi:diguanylate cyclase (GGDEF)-like protein